MLLMPNTLFNWLMGLVESFANIGSWLTTPLFNNLTPLHIIGGSGMIIVIGIWLVKFLNPIN